MSEALGPKLQSRKWWAFVGAFVTATFLLMMSKITGDVWSSSVIIFYGTYVTGNVVEKKW
ncbi:MAG: hypothetical protein HRT93_03000 [Piscirickettsiaceae bacterium]|nr:hypothetical protein [Piscirickettsiaceae bacterium]